MTQIEVSFIAKEKNHTDKSMNCFRVRLFHQKFPSVKNHQCVVESEPVLVKISNLKDYFAGSKQLHHFPSLGSISSLKNKNAIDLHFYELPTHS